MVATSSILPSVESSTGFFSLAPEIRDKIYRHLLVSSTPVGVRNLWTELARRTRRRRGNCDSGTRGNDSIININILLVCRQTAAEGIRVLYSENTFLYQLRDPEVVCRLQQEHRLVLRTAPRGFPETGINLEKYAHLLRHITIELEPNRSGTAYEKLMAAAIQALALPHIRLYKLTITVSPLFETYRRKAGGSGTVKTKYLSVVPYFSKNAPVLKALLGVNTRFLRINVHTNSKQNNSTLGRRRAPTPIIITTASAANNNNAGVDSSSDSDSGNNIFQSSAAAYKKTSDTTSRHYEATLDLRYVPWNEVNTPVKRQLSPSPLPDQFEHDELAQAKRRERGQVAKQALLSLRRHIEEACTLSPAELKCVGNNIWEEHAEAEKKRKEK